ncbi:MAG: peptide chain release factor 3, partial [Acutalibacteraceae bacterium]|nr:peptide chain release factor 3 [Acutalibacteraceae bacterium]
EREIVDEAYAGDIIGVFDPGVFSIGDTVCSPKNKVTFEGIPTFAPEHFAVYEQVDTLKRKQFVKGMTQIAQEGAIQIFHEPESGMERVIVGVVGVLQFEVLEYRLKNEYNVDVRKTPMPYELIRWIEGENIDVKKLNLTSDTKLVQDFKDRYLLIFTSEWNINWALQKNEGLILSEFSNN